MIDDSNAITGISTDIVRAIVEQTDHSYNLLINDWSKSYQQALTEPNVCIYSMAHLPSRAPLFQWVGEIIHVPASFYSLRERNISLENLDDARQFMVVVSEQDAVHQYLLSKGFKENRNIYPMRNTYGLLELLDVRREMVDLALINDVIINSHEKSRNELAKYKKHPVPNDFTFKFYLACSLTTAPEIVTDLSKALKQIKTDSRYQNILNKWQKELGFQSSSVK